MISSITEIAQNLILVTTCYCHMVKIEFLRNITTPYIGKNRQKLCQIHNCWIISCVQCWDQMWQRWL